MNKISSEAMKRMLADQQDEITAHHLYKKIALIIKDENNKKIVEHVAADEIKHYKRLKSLTGRDFKAQRVKVFIFYWMTRILGLTFGIKYLENSEGKAVKEYSKDVEELNEMAEIIEDEERHEAELISMIDEERLNYMGSVVLGLNDALVELTGALAGFTFAFQNTRIIALTGLITGISASFSMAASEYLSTRHKGEGNPVKSAVYTGISYVFTVLFLILPYLIIGNPFISLGVSLGVAVLIIFVFNYYISVAKDYDFKKRFLEMAGISLGVAALSFLIGILIKQFIGIEV
ncbi:MAG: VIT1/CCC1 transporter family protein [Thermodesulfobacteriota bacterium]|nr:VIT1/CCC1 transporter family protein [Thermodesulfobacteriota bacterium]